MADETEREALNGMQPESTEPPHHHHHHHDSDECHDPNCTDPSHHHHHHHDSDECHDPNCTEPSHHHHHHHDSDECDDPNCTDPSHHHHHHHDLEEREELIDDAMVLSRSRRIEPAEPLSPQELRERGERCFLRLGERLGVDGIILGHIKGVIETEHGALAFSVTRVGDADITELGDWQAQERVSAFTMTVNIMSLIPAEIFEDDLFEGMDR
jgi:hypothetical protein